MLQPPNIWYLLIYLLYFVNFPCQKYCLKTSWFNQSNNICSIPKVGTTFMQYVVASRLQQWATTHHAETQERWVHNKSTIVFVREPYSRLETIYINHKSVMVSFSCWVNWLGPRTSRYYLELLGLGQIGDTRQFWILVFDVQTVSIR